MPGIDLLYRPTVERVSSLVVPTITFVEKDGDIADIFDEKLDLDRYLDELYISQPQDLMRGGDEFHIAFVWALGDTAMSDVFVCDIEAGTENYGPLVTAYAYKGMEISDHDGNGSGVTMSIVGRELDVFMRCRGIRHFLSERASLDHLPEDWIAGHSYGE